MTSLSSLPKFVLHVCLPVAIGASIYVGWRSTNLVVFHWIEAVSFTELIPRPQIELPRLVLYALPDGCWVYATTSWMLIIWNRFVPWAYSGLAIALASEFGQKCGLVPGAFDYLDVLFYVAAFLLAGVCNAQTLFVRNSFDGNGGLSFRQR